MSNCSIGEVAKSPLIQAKIPDFIEKPNSFLLKNTIWAV